MSGKQYMVTGVTHVDLAWKWGRDEMSEMQEAFVIRLLDALEQNPEWTYVIEQAAHFRVLAQRRPELIARLKRHVQEGRVEMMGGMASTLETNLPDGECFVRNQMLGMRWVREHFGVEVMTGWLIDTFGIHAQIPQILRQFGIRHLMANRFGAKERHDVFVARGLDGSEVLIAGSDVHAPYVSAEHLAFRYCVHWSDIERLFERAARMTGDGPVLVTPYTENEVPVSLRPIEIVRRMTEHSPGSKWGFAVPRAFFEALEATGRAWPVRDGDLNPEFTGTFSLRPRLRIRNRRVETLLLEAEKWAALVGLDEWEESVEAAWWEMAHVQFHDVLTGSHPTSVYRETMEILDSVEQSALHILDSAFDAVAVPAPAKPAQGKTTVTVFNGLPWDRTDVLRLPLPDGVADVGAVTESGRSVPFEVRERELLILARAPAIGANTYAIDSGGPAAMAEPAMDVEHAVIENEYLILEFDRRNGLKSLIHRESGRELLADAGDFLVIQRDDGNYQIENPAGSEVPASSGEIHVFAQPPSSLGSRIVTTGSFPPGLAWTGSDAPLEWRAEWMLVPGKPRLDLHLTLAWHGESSRVRLKLRTGLDTSEGVYEIPFGTVRRRPYGTTPNAKGEWPALRFVAIQDGDQGFALINTGTPGVEVNGGTIWNTLLRAPRIPYVGMLPDDTSSQHGTHEFRFAIAAWTGALSDSDLIEQAQETNNPLHALVRTGSCAPIDPASRVRIEGRGVVLSAIRKPEDGADELIVRLYEPFGVERNVTLHVAGAVQGWHSNLREQKLDPTPCADGLIPLAFRPFEIKTVRVMLR